MACIAASIASWLLKSQKTHQSEDRILKCCFQVLRLDEELLTTRQRRAKTT